VLGVVYDPFCEELWTARAGQRARLNGRPIRASRRRHLREAIICVGFAKEPATLRRMLPVFDQLVGRVRKMRIMGSAALALAYVASGRVDAYLEFGLRLWDVAAGSLLIECAGGEFWSRPLPAPHSFRIVANNGLLRRRLAPWLKPLET
jgi:myo-inositol-1(or 4)-monophosphatase